MPLAQRIANLVRWRPLQPGEAAPDLSLTAEDGTWIRLPDFKNHLAVILVFVRDPAAAGDWLRDLDASRPELEALEAVVFAVTPVRTDKLRAVRADLGLGFHLLYDPFAVDARAYRASSRWRPVPKDTVTIVGKDGRAAWSERGRPSGDQVLAALARLRGVELQPDAPRSDVRVVDSEAAVALLTEPGSRWLLLDVRTASEFEADHAPQAIHIPVDELPQRYQELGQTDHILCVCQAGSRSAAAAQFLTSIGGGDIGDVEGGMSGWSGPRITGGVAQ